MRVGVLGPQGTFSEIAAKKWHPGCRVRYFEEIPDVAEAVMSGEIDAGVLPIENSIEGSVNITLDLLSDRKVKIIGEVVVPVMHHLLAKTDAEKIYTIISHPQALAQCRCFIRSQFSGVELKTTSSTASAAELAAQTQGVAAIASVESAKIYDLSILAENIQDVSGNFTRFAVLGCKSISLSGGLYKTSVILHLKHNRAGALYELLGEFAKRGIDLTKIESRPTKKALEDYLFYVDFKGHIKEERIAFLLESVRKHVDRLKVLGSYPVATAQLRCAENNQELLITK